MKKKYTTPKMEVKKCLVEDFIAATTQGGSQETPSGSDKIETGDEANIGSKSFNWDSWDE